MGLFDFIKPAPYQEPIADSKSVNATYKYWRFRIFYSMYIGYAFFYFTRKSYTFAMPALMTELGFTKMGLGALASVLYFTYGISKFVSGILSDKSNPRFIMAIGLILTGIFNIFFGFSSSIFFFVLFWGLNGWFQGWGWPPCARLLTHWYSHKERGTWWGFWNTSHNIGGALIPILVSWAIVHFGSWRFALWIPGAMCIVVGLFLLNRLRDTPQSLGLPAIEDFKEDYQDREKGEVERELTAKEILFKYVLANKFIWILSIAYFFVYIIRTAVNDWGLIFLSDEKGISLLKAGICMSCFEIGGALGGLVSGWLSDRVFNGKRGPVNILFSIGAILSILAIWKGPNTAWMYHFVAIFFSGFFIFGPQMLIGIVAAEVSHKKAAGTATGFAGWVAYFGAMATGPIVGAISDHLGWNAFFIFLAGCGIVAVMLLFPLWSIKSGREVVKAQE